ncbi:hypothetical protein ACFPM0_23595 [Pseudonocardia sulfidoxydans]|uniref:hypothetical protein n=1 Tax=Pseudonocardia sulfidoxydans TaxID=54011 RepID=UPI00361D1C66
MRTQPPAPHPPDDLAGPRPRIRRRGPLGRRPALGARRRSGPVRRHGPARRTAYRCSSPVAVRPTIATRSGSRPLFPP